MGYVLLLLLVLFLNRGYVLLLPKQKEFWKEGIGGTNP